MPDKKTAKRKRTNAMKNVPKENLHLLLDTVESINRAVEYKSILSESMEAIRIVMDTEASSLMLIDENTGELQVSIPTGSVKDQISGLRIPKHEGIGGWVVKYNKPYISNDVTESELFYGDLSDKFITRNVICVPLVHNSGNVIGVLQAVNRRNNADFTSRDIPVFQALASHIALAVERGMHIVQLTNLIKEKDTHLKETHHRIKNNFQVITGLIDLKIPEVEDESTLELLKELQSRISTMAQIHEMLCEQDGFRDVELDKYLKQLSDKINLMMGTRFTRPEVLFSSSKVTVPAEKALMCGIILNELLINIYKHAFNGVSKTGKIQINITGEAGMVQLRVSDNGVGLPENFETGKSNSIGMWIVRDMLNKLDGSMEVQDDSGVEFMISFPV